MLRGGAIVTHKSLLRELVGSLFLTLELPDLLFLLLNKAYVTSCSRILAKFRCMLGTNLKIIG